MTDTPKIQDIFQTEPNRSLPLNYVEREHVDGLFHDLVARGLTVTLYASSKQGKSSLRKHVLGDNCLLIRCTKTTNRSTLYEELFVALGFSQVKVEGESLGAQFTHVTIDGPVIKAYAVNLRSPRAVASILREFGRERYVAIEEFHYVPQDEAKAFAADLKSLIEEGCTKFVIIGVWRDANHLVELNSDLSTRIEGVNADKWTTQDLTGVVDRGFSLLGLNIDEHIRRDIVASASGSIFLVQKIAREVASLAGRNAPLDVDQIVQRIVDREGFVYINKLKTIAAGTQNRAMLVYKVIVRRLLTANPNELEHGISQQEFRVIAHQYEAQESVDNALQRLNGLQERKFSDGSSLVVFEDGPRHLVFVDRIFTAWLRKQDQESLSDMIGVGEHQLRAIVPSATSSQRLRAGSNMSTPAPVPLAVPPHATTSHPTATSNEMKTQLRILHLSDIHFGSHHYFDNNALARASVPKPDRPDLLRYIRQSSVEYDVVVVSGDLTQQATQGEFEQAGKFLSDISTKTLPNGSTAQVPLLVVPGNHDVSWTLANASPTDRSLPLYYFAACLNVLGLKVSGREPEECWCFLDLRPEFQVLMIGLNSAVLENASDHRGYIGESQLRAALAVLNKNDPNHNCVRIAVFHHHIESVPTIEQDLKVADEVMREVAYVKQALLESRVDLVMHGHRHHGYTTGVMSTKTDQVLFVSGCGSSGVDVSERGSQPLEIRLVTISQDGGEAELNIAVYHFDVAQRLWILQRDPFRHSLRKRG